MNEILLVCWFVVVQICKVPLVNCLTYERGNDFVKIQADPVRHHPSGLFRKNRFVQRSVNVNASKENINVHPFNAPLISVMGINKKYSQEKRNNKNNKNITKPTKNKKWQVGRVSRKQYEIINMLWRKTKIFVNIEQTTPSRFRKRDNDTKRNIDSVPASQAFLQFPSYSNLPLMTPSYIEFYYLDETDEHFKDFTTRKTTIRKPKTDNTLKTMEKFKLVSSNNPKLAFRIADPYIKQQIPIRYIDPSNRIRRRKQKPNDVFTHTNIISLKSLTTSYMYPYKRPNQSILKFESATSTTKAKISSTIKHKNISLNKSSTYRTDGSTTESLSTPENSFDNETCPMTTEIFTTLDTTNSTKNTTVYDKIKFFEMYDKQTRIPPHNGKEKGIYLHSFDDQNNEIQPEQKILLKHVDQIMGNRNNTHKAKHAKKHILESYKSDSKGQNNVNVLIKKVIMKPANITVSEILNVTKRPVKKLLLTSKAVVKFFENQNSRPAGWLQFPFAAVYVYESTQVHCDAAAISPHWLVTSGSCLSRHHKNPGGVGRSAFVAYCGESWWRPERVAYVKYSVVHPRFHPHDKTRKHLYNIGLVQVVTSMASACNGWAPIPLMSHQFISDVEGSIANAIGWGLDRFDTRYSSSDLPKLPLMSYESRLYSNSCPGNVDYSKAMRFGVYGVKNVYCLSLPPYVGEDTDPVHGGLLIMGGKLIALYLQEERRPWGEQCAQYTGTWGLVPWVLSVARENEEENDAFIFDI